MITESSLNESNEISSLILHPSSFEAGKRLDAYLAEKIENRSRSRVQKMIDEGDVLVNGKPAKSSHKVSDKDEIEVELTELPVEIFEPENIPLNIVYEDEFLAVINKPAGMVVHPGAGISSGTLANAIAFHFNFEVESRELGVESEERGAKGEGRETIIERTISPKSKIQNPKSKIQNRVGIVHRLDKDTSGLIVVAKDEQTHEALSEQFRERQVFKQYLALVHGEIETNNGTIDAPIAREKHNRTKMSIRAHGRNALSLWKVKKRFEKFTLVAVEIKTGRTHQIRVHLAYINHPVVGDETYNAGRDKNVADHTIRNAIKNLNRFFLHAEKLAFTHPKTQERLNFAAELPQELSKFLEML